MATATATAAGNSREARRRRIAERGSDRLALITGRIQSLPSEPDQSTPSADSPQFEGTAIDSLLPPHESDKETIHQDSLNETFAPLLPSSEKGRSIVSRAVSLLDAEKEYSQVGKSIVSRAVTLLDAEKEFSQTSSSIERPLLEHQNERQSNHNKLTTGQIRSAIAASENIRMFCSIAAAFLVIFSYTGFPILGWGFVQSVILFRPLYLLLLTNISIALGRLILGTQSKGSRMGQTNNVPIFGGNTLDQLGQALEAGVLLQSIFGALFMDFSVYAVVLVCGLSMVRSLGW